MQIELNKQTGKLTFKRQGWKEYFRILLIGRNSFLLHEPSLRSYRAVYKDAVSDYIVCWVFPFSIIAKAFYFIRGKWYELARYFYKKGMIEGIKKNEPIPLFWLPKLRLGRRIIKVVKMTAGGSHCWCESSVGMVRKPIREVPQRILDAYYKEQRSAIGELNKKGTT